MTHHILAFVVVTLLGGCATSPHPAKFKTARERYESIILPEVTFTEAELADVINFLRCASVEYYPEEPRGLNFTFDHDLAHHRPERKITLR